MKSGPRGGATLEAEITAITGHGIRLRVDGRELYLPFDAFPWFRDAVAAAVRRVERPAPDHLHWPDLDVDLEIDSIEHPEKYPLLSHHPSSSQD